MLSAATSAKSCNLPPAQRSREGPAACLQQRSYAAVKPFKGPFHELQPASTRGGGKQGEPRAHESWRLLSSPNLCFLPWLGEQLQELAGDQAAPFHVSQITKPIPDSHLIVAEPPVPCLCQTSPAPPVPSPLLGSSRSGQLLLSSCHFSEEKPEAQGKLSDLLKFHSWEVAKPGFKFGYSNPKALITG